MYDQSTRYAKFNEKREEKASFLYYTIKSGKQIYDPKTNRYLGREPLDLLFYLILFVTIVAAMIAIFVGMFFAFTEGTINEDRPYRTGRQNVLNNVPSLSFRPVIDFKTALIKYSDADPSTYMMYIQSMRTFVQPYEDKDLVSEDAYATCKDGIKTPDDVNKPCRYDLKIMGRCIKEFNFGYDRTRPCIFLKLNKVYGWIPDVTNSSESKDILVSCQGLNTEDIEYFPNVMYYPNVTVRGVVYGYFSHLYYPYLVQYGYRQPLIGVEIDRPKKNVVLMVKCRVINLLTPSDTLTFEILVD